MRAKKGISLIVLVITIIVIIILAAAVLLSLNNNNPIQNAKQATMKNDASELKSAVALYISNYMANDPAHASPFKANASGVVTFNKTSTTTTVDYHTAVTDTTDKAVSELNFSAWGVSSDAIVSFTFNPTTNVFTFTPAAGYTTEATFTM